VSVDQLSDAARSEAHRHGGDAALNAAVKDAGQQELDFGEQIEFAKAKLSNYVDGIARRSRSRRRWLRGMTSSMTPSRMRSVAESRRDQTTMNLIKRARSSRWTSGSRVELRASFTPRGR
jgi:ribosomal protein S12 methylthiotransferase accessory factor YcaO